MFYRRTILKVHLYLNSMPLLLSELETERAFIQPALAGLKGKVRVKYRK